MALSPTATCIPPEVREAALRGEPDRYLAATLAPPEARPALAAIAAFSAELARIPATVSEPLLGDIRLQWWRDALHEGRRGQHTGHHVADALVAAERRHGLAPELLSAMIDARELDLAGGLPQDDAGLAAYLEATEGHPFRLALDVLGARRAEDRALATAAGLAYGIARSLGRLPTLLHNGGFPLPAERLRASGVDPARLTEAPVQPGLKDAVAQVADDLRALARAALASLRGRWQGLPRQLGPALWPLVMVEPYFRAQSGRSLLVETADVSPLHRALRIGAARLTGRL
jgi:phytoene synthase